MVFYFILFLMIIFRYMLQNRSPLLIVMILRLLRCCVLYPISAIVVLANFASLK
uniref:Uncharacterized protein n=1 Tax=Octopus bimaculoides TaxID=37653 RepID=A0A0L8GLN9_OCTBM